MQGQPVYVPVHQGAQALYQPAHAVFYLDPASVNYLPAAALGGSQPQRASALTRAWGITAIVLCSIAFVAVGLIFLFFFGLTKMCFHGCGGGSLPLDFSLGFGFSLAILLLLIVLYSYATWSSFMGTTRSISQLRSAFAVWTTLAVIDSLGGTALLVFMIQITSWAAAGIGLLVGLFIVIVVSAILNGICAHFTRLDWQSPHRV